ncbi:MAG: response regulator [Verrucomicrobiota bacterium]|jgi:DNA-binding NarL/FixJ family response regulator
MEDGLIKLSLHILCLEDDEHDRRLMEAALTKDGLNCQIVQVQERNDFEAILKLNQFDLIVSDFSLPGYDGATALATAKKIQPDTPFILLSGTIGEERAVDFLKAGATDCVLKQNLSRLGPSVRRAIAEAKEKMKRQMAEELLRTQAAELRALAARLQASREEERIRISRELHDEMGEMLTAQKFALSWMRQQLSNCDKVIVGEEIFARIDSLGLLIDGMTNRVRQLCTELRPSILDHLGLLAAIEWQANEFQLRTGIVCHIPQKVHSLNLNEQQATAVFRIFQEILTNVARHARASEVQIELKFAGQNLILKVQDNGEGISDTRINGGTSLGILGMRERMTLLGGELLIQGIPEKGTTVTLSVPLNRIGSGSADKRVAMANGEKRGDRLSPTTDNPLRILVVDDHAVFRQGLKQLLAENFPDASFGEAGNAHQALELLDNATWDVLLLDLSMPGRGGLDVLEQAKNIQPRTKILVLTMHPADQYAVRVLKAGASGYLTKESVTEEVVTAIKKVLAGGKYVTAALAEKLLLNLNDGGGKPHEQLSDREYQVLVTLAMGKSVKEIGAELSLSAKTISTYRARILQKLQFKTNADIVSYAMREQLIG